MITNSQALDISTRARCLRLTRLNVIEMATAIARRDVLYLDELNEAEGAELVAQLGDRLAGKKSGPDVNVCHSKDEGEDR